MSSLLERMRGLLAPRAKLSKDFGRLSEKVASKYLRKLGYVHIEQNYHDHCGEIDLIMVDSRTVVFVEVKARRSDDGGAGHEAVDETKQKKLAKVALSYLQRNDLLENAYRFDVVSLHWPASQTKPEIAHFKDAFQPAETNQLF